MGFGFRGDPRGAARQRRAIYDASQAPLNQAASLITTVSVTVDANNLLELGYQTGELIPVAAGQTIKGLTMMPQGTWRRCRFGAGCTLLFDAVNFILPGLNTIVTGDGDVGTFYSNGGTPNAQGQWTCIEYTRGGTPPPNSYGVFIAQTAMNTNLAGGTYSNGVNNDGFGATLTFAVSPNINGTASSGLVGLNVLLANQTDGTTSGLYTVTSALTLTRAAGLCTSNQFPGSVILVFGSGTVDYAGLWFFALAGAPTVGVTVLAFEFAMLAMTSAQIYVANTNGFPVPTTLSGVITLSNAGATAFASSTGSGAVVLGTAPAIVGGSITALTALAIRDTSAAFDVTLAATSSTTLAAGRTLTVDMVNAAATIKLGFNLTLSAAATIGGTHSGTSSGTNTGDQTITLTGGVTGSGTGSFAATVVTNANLTGPVTSAGNATSVATSFALTGQATPTMTGGQLVYDTTQNTFGFGSGPVATPVNTWAVGMLFASTASVSSTTTAETKSMVGSGVGTMTIPANMPGVGCVLRLRARGVYTTAGTVGNITWFVKIGTVTVTSTGVIALVAAGQTNKYWEIDCDIVFRAVGNSGSVMAQGSYLWVFGTIQGGDTGLYPIRGNNADPPAVVAIDTTSARLIDLQMTTSANGNTIVCNMVSLERLM